jgi:hypothetical protein
MSFPVCLLAWSLAFGLWTSVLAFGLLDWVGIVDRQWVFRRANAAVALASDRQNSAIALSVRGPWLDRISRDRR